MKKHLDTLLERFPVLNRCKDEIWRAYEVLEECFSTGHMLMISGNGGSCSDSEHIVGELMKEFVLPRRCSTEFADTLKRIDAKRGEELALRLQGALPAIALDGGQSLNTAYINDVENGGLLTFAQQVYGYGKKGDVLWGISTSGNSKNVMNAAVVARALGMKVIGMTGDKGGELAAFADVSIKAPATETYQVQELHLPIYHCLCMMLEKRFFGKAE